MARMQAQIDELRAASAATAAEQDAAATADRVKEPLFHISGFIDMGLQKLWTSDPALHDLTNATFVLGNINLYFDFHPAEDWSSLVEVRLTNYPAGATIDGVRVDTTVPDPGNSLGDDTVKWGSIILERAYIQWQHKEQLGVRVGQFLTPYGIWNVDHGTPTLISLYRPEFVSLELWPDHQIGAEVFGTLRDLLPGRWTLEYHAYVSNGRTAGAVDTNNGKMLGGRLIAATTRPYRMAFGVSFMRGDFDEAVTTISTDATVTATKGRVAYGESGVGVDASLDLGALRLRAEAIVRRVQYSAVDPAASATYGEQINALEGDTYAIAAYRIRGTKLEPYLYEEALRVPEPNGNLQFTSSVGLNYYFTPAIQLKMQFSRSMFYEPPTPHASDIHEDFLAGKLVMGF